MSEPKVQYRTENNFMNRKIKYVGYVGAAVTVITFILGLVKSIFPELGPQIEIKPEDLTELLTAVATGIAGIVTIVSLIAGFKARPGEGDGIVVDPPKDGVK